MKCFIEEELRQKLRTVAGYTWDLAARYHREEDICNAEAMQAIGEHIEQQVHESAGGHDGWGTKV